MTVKTSELFDLSGKVAVVPGGGGAIGSALATGLADAGASVALTGRTRESLDRAMDAINESGGRAIAIVADATKPDDAQRSIDETVAGLGRVDIIVNAIGGGAGDVLFEAQEYPGDAWDWIMELNIRSALLPTQAAVRQMITQGDGGKVLNISSVRGQLGIDAGYSAYVAAKGALDALTRQWATEWAKHRISVNAISPTFVDTPQVASLLADPEFKSKIVSRIPIGRVGTTDDLLGAALLFCSDASAFITGQVLTLDGGLTATQ
jgi:NAD(P)-dependent dehydrogenase (short-subunit alcohol dehydrogenase family)